MAKCIFQVSQNGIDGGPLPDLSRTSNSRAVTPSFQQTISEKAVRALARWLTAALKPAPARWWVLPSPAPDVASPHVLALAREKVRRRL